MKSKLFQDPLPSQSSCGWNQSDRGSAEPHYRTDSQLGYGDPGGGGAVGPGAAADRLHPPHLEKNKIVLELKRSQQHYGPSGASNNSLTATNSYPQGNPSPFSATSGGQAHFQGSQHPSPHPIQPQYSPQLTSPPHPETDSALEAAVNSILEC